MRISSRDSTRLLNLWFGSGRLNARFTVQAAFECRKSSLHFYGIEYVWPRNGLFILRHSRFS